MRVPCHEAFGSARAEQAVAGVAQAGKDVSELVKLAIQSGGENVHVRMRVQHPLHADPPVASIGSTMMKSRSAGFGGILK